MNHIERFYATIERRPTDRPASWLGIPDLHALPQLYKHFGASGMKELKACIDDDIYPVEMPYHSPTSNAIYAAFDFAKRKTDGSNEERTLTAPGFFEDYTDASAVDLFDWPEPEKYIDPEECRRPPFLKARRHSTGWQSCGWNRGGCRWFWLQIVPSPRRSERRKNIQLRGNPFFEAVLRQL